VDDAGEFTESTPYVGFMGFQSSDIGLAYPDKQLRFPEVEIKFPVQSEPNLEEDAINRLDS
jgi:hypothetical protein